MVHVIHVTKVSNVCIGSLPTRESSIDRYASATLAGNGTDVCVIRSLYLRGATVTLWGLTCPLPAISLPYR